MVFPGYKWWNWPYANQNIKDLTTFLNDLLLKPNCIKPNSEQECDNLWPSSSFLFWDIKNSKSLPKEQHLSLLSGVKMLVWNINKDLSQGQDVSLKTKWHCKAPCPTGKLKNKGRHLYESLSFFWGQNTFVKLQPENLGKASLAHSMEKPKLQSTSLEMPQNVLRSNAYDAFFKIHSGEGYTEKK